MLFTYACVNSTTLSAELISDIRFTISEGEQALAHEPTRYVRHLSFGDHAFLLYDTEDVKREITFSFLEAGLSKGEAVVYLVSEHKLYSETREIQKYGINFDRKEAFTIMSADEWYLKKGKAQAKTIISNWKTLCKEKLKAGFTGLRAASEMEVFFNYAKTKELLRYETSLGRQLAPNLCGLCLYDINRLDENQLIRVIRCHGHLISKDIVGKTKV